MDRLSALVDLVDAQCTLSGAVIARGTWGVHLPPPKSLKLLVIKVRAWFCWGDDKPFLAEAGDIVVAQHGRSFRMGSSPKLTLGGDVSVARDSEIAKAEYSSSDCVALACHVTLNNGRGRPLLAALPTHILVSGSGHEAQVLRFLYEQLVRELRAEEAGSSLAAERLTQLILLQVLRAHSASLAERCAVPDQDWLNALKDSGLGKALHAMHRNPEHKWGLEELASIASMSRTRFAEQFRATMGGPPLTYLRNMRMAMAAKGLGASRRPIAEIGHQLGYESESAFSAAFKKTMKVSPKRYRDQLLSAH
jgi:AraC-like DNA-binding protein